MTITQLRTVQPLTQTHSTARQNDARTPIGQILVDRGAISPGDLTKALALQIREDVMLGDILLANGFVTEDALFDALSEQAGAQIVDLQSTLPDARLIDRIGVKTCLKGRFVPWKRVGPVTVIVTARPADFERLQRELPDDFGSVRMAIAPEREVLRALQRIRQGFLTNAAETCVADQESCRNWHTPAKQRYALAFLAAVAAVILLAPKAAVTVLCLWIVGTLLLSSGMKFAAAFVQLRAHIAARRKPLFSHQSTTVARLPVVSIMVPLFHERKIATHLVKRLEKISYPRELLDICMVVEADDHTTAATLSTCELPQWIRVVTVPAGAVRTKPRALNYALEFCRGSIIGVYDAEDAPEPGQIHAVVRRFHERGSEVACLQGMLDFYNSRTNWLSRCFAVEYATWFRVVLPGIQKLGFAIPLGGTTLFFRRAALEELGGWDAHNVTEDADLGIRLARHGYRAEIIETTTDEEANCRTWPWVKQRSRWLKGYAITWAVHMRNPARLFRELGAWKFFGVQVLFLGTLSQYVLAPLLWTFWLVPLGFWHPIQTVLSSQGIIALGGLFFLTEILSIVVNAAAVSGKKHRHLMIWVPTLHFYFPLGALASYKGLYELIVRPFYWDKTEHGLFDDQLKNQSAADLT